MSSREKAAQSAAAQKNAGKRNSTTQSLKEWYKEFNGGNTGGSKPLSEQPSAGTSSSEEPMSAQSPDASENLSKVKSILKDPKARDAAETIAEKKRISLKVNEKRVARRERINLFEDYRAYFGFHNDLERIKETTTQPGFYFCFDRTFNLCVVVVHKKGKSETHYFSDIVQTEADKAIIQELTAQLHDYLFHLFQRGINMSGELLLTELSLTDNILALVTANCTHHLTRIPLSHNEMHPMHIYKFYNSDKENHLLETYFFEENIRESFIFDEDCHDPGDAYIVFMDKTLSEDQKKQINTARAKRYKLILIDVEDGMRDINSIIDKINIAYTIPREDLFISEFKRRVADFAKQTALQIVEAKKEFSARAEEMIAKEKAAREAAAREAAAREAAAREAAAREAAAREEAAREAAVKEEAAREEVVREEVVREERIGEEAVREKAAREEAVREEAAREEVVREEGTGEEAAREEAAGEEAAGEEVAREGVAEEEVAEEEVAEEEVADLKNRLAHQYEKFIVSDLIRIYIIANTTHEIRKKEVSTCIRQYYRDQHDPEANAFEVAVKAIKSLYIDSYGEAQVQPVPVQPAILSRDNVVLEVAAETTEKKAEDVEPMMTQLPALPSIEGSGSTQIVEVEQKALSEIPRVDTVKNSKITELKNLLAEGTEQIITSNALVKMYEAIEDHPEVILGYYESYQNRLKEIDEKLINDKKALFKKSFRDFDQCEREEKKLEDAMQAAKKKALDDLAEKIKSHYRSPCVQIDDAKEQVVEQKIEITMAAANQSAKQPSGSIADADIKKRLQEMEKHTFFYSAPEMNGHEKKEANKVEEKTKPLSSAIFPPAQVKGENVKKEVEELMEKVEPLSLSRQGVSGVN